MNKPLSLIIPIFNEEEILARHMAYLLPELRQSYGPFEVILSENGSTDSTKELARKMAEEYDEVQAIIDDDAPCYGRALLVGLRAAAHEECAILELDYLDLDFLARGYEKLGDTDLLIGSKKLTPGIDRRGFKRRMFTELYNILLRAACRVSLSDTHGLKVLRKSSMLPIAESCITTGAVWPSELCVRASLEEDVDVEEIPLTMPLEEIRTTRINAMKRIRKTLEDINTLRKAVRSR